MRKIIVVLSMILILVSTGCSEQKNKESLVIYTTNYAQKFIIESIGLDYVEAYSIYDNTYEYDLEKANEFEYEIKDPETFELSKYPKLKENILKSDLFIYNGKSDKDKNVLNDLVSDKASEKLELLDSTKNADISTVEKSLALSYDNKAVSDQIYNVLTTTAENEMFWLSPIEMQNVSAEIYSFLVKALPNKKSELKENYQSLIYDLDTLYASIERVSKDTVNNMVVSDTHELNILKIHYIENISLDNTNTNYPDKDQYLNALSQYITINESKVISTTNRESEYFFDLAEVQSIDDYKNGENYYEIMSRNYSVLESALAN